MYSRLWERKLTRTTPHATVEFCFCRGGLVEWVYFDDEAIGLALSAGFFSRHH